MANLVSAYKLHKEFAGKKLFNGLNFGLEENERVGLIGPNGAGKSTLLKILAGLSSQDSGELARKSGLKVSYLSQLPTFPEGATLMSAVQAELDPHLEDWEQQMKALEALELLKIEDEGYTPETSVSELSGGWRKKLAIAREWAKEPDLLLLDEPTNHLDVQSILWLEQMLTRASYSYVVITHDRAFLQNVTNRIVELDPRNVGGILSVKGDYAAYLEVKEQMLSASQAQESNLKNRLRRETEWLRRGPKARSTKQQARIDRAYDLGDEVMEIQERNQNKKVQLHFSAVEGGPKKLIEAINISKSFSSGKMLFKNLTFTLSRSTRVGILGRNGAGKSTLIKTLLGELEPDTGLIKKADHLQVSYFEQNRDALDPEITLTRAVCPQGEYVKFRGNFVHIRSYLDRFLFRPEQFDLPLKRLSGGEQSRILIAQLMLKEANVLVLDEPTNDLDVATLDLLQDQLEAFEGAIVLVTHDRYFLDQTCDQILSLDKGNVEEFHSLSQWEQAQQRVRANPKEVVPPPSAVKSSASVSSKKKLSYNEQRELAEMEKTITKKEADLELLTGKSQLSSLSALERQKVFTELAALQTEIERLYKRWAELEPTEAT